MPKSDSHAQRQIPPNRQTDPQTGKDHVAPPSILQLKISSMLQKQAEAQGEPAQVSPEEPVDAEPLAFEAETAMAEAHVSESKQHETGDPQLDDEGTVKPRELLTDEDTEPRAAKPGPDAS